MVSSEAATVSAIQGGITDPRDWSVEIDYPLIEETPRRILNTTVRQAPLPAEESAAIESAYSPSIVAIPEFDPHYRDRSTASENS